jgi:tetratricopeptide (TPR) repeat protein
VVQITPKQMKIMEQNSNQIILKGFGSDLFGVSFSDYGLTINYNDDEIDNCILHLYDRNVDIKYLKSEIETDQEISSALMLNFENANRYIQDFIRMPHSLKIEIATKTDELNNIGVDYYEEDDIVNAIKYYNKALDVFSLNDDALKNLIVCYREINDFENMQKAQNLLDIVRRLGL